MTKIFPITTRLILFFLMVISIMSCGKDDTPTAISTPKVPHVITASTISDGKPITEITSTNYGTNVFNYDTLSFEITIVNGEPVFITASPSERPPIWVNDSNEFLRYEDRAYAIIVFGGVLVLEEI